MEKRLESADLTKVEPISDYLHEGEATRVRRKEYLAAYLDSPYETNQIFLKNYERPPIDPLEYEPAGVEGPSSLLPQENYHIGCVGASIFNARIRAGFEFENGEKDSDSPVLFEGIPAGSDKFEFLNAALRNSYHRIVAASVHDYSGPLIRLTVLPDERKSLHRFTHVTFSKDTRSTFLDKLRENSAGRKGGLMTETLYVKLESGAEVNFVTVYTGDSQVAVNYRFELAEGSRLRFVSWIGGNPYIRSRINVTLRGEGSDAGIFTGNFADNRARHDMLATVEHLGMNSVGLAVQNGVVRSSSRLLLKGMMIIRKPARGSDSHLKQHALLLSSDSFANAIPGLEIETNELKAKHAASVSRPDEEQLFYLMSRGMNEKQAITTIAFGNLGPLISNIYDESLRDQLSDEMLISLLK